MGELYLGSKRSRGGGIAGTPHTQGRAFCRVDVSAKPNSITLMSSGSLKNFGADTKALTSNGLTIPAWLGGK